ncbi:MAG: hypothetical protein ORN49_07105, partial [Rhodobacteraceae bacterium]|nr:hypothetical protein [Paracoccaceae bacterium]
MKKPQGKLQWLVIAGLLLVIGFGLSEVQTISVRSPEPVTIRLDPGQTFQTFRAWEATIETPAGLTPLPQRDAIYDSLINDIGITRLRLEVYAGDEGGNGPALRDYYSGKISEEGWLPARYTTINDDDDPFH